MEDLPRLCVLTRYGAKSPAIAKYAARCVPGCGHSPRALADLNRVTLPPIWGPGVVFGGKQAVRRFESPESTMPKRLSDQGKSPVSQNLKIP
jgi:hypothetical protein